MHGFAEQLIGNLEAFVAGRRATGSREVRERFNHRDQGTEESKSG